MRNAGSKCKISKMPLERCHTMVFALVAVVAETVVLILAVAVAVAVAVVVVVVVAWSWC